MFIAPSKITKIAPTLAAKCGVPENVIAFNKPKPIPKSVPEREPEADLNLLEVEV